CKRIRGDIQKLVNDILARGPNLRVVIVDYDYLDPEKISTVYKAGMPGAFFHVPAKTFNKALLELGHEKRDLARKTPRCFYVENWGLLRKKYGPGAMPDGVHPTPEGFQAIFANAIQRFYGKWLR
ncbi:MAG: SGNH/GDSL hydrolase family protein, partial [Acidobacteria bacterium]|nr:SGNH/GDSL hydrolase family protein [Acidobacteriota bacterium]